MFIHFSFFCYYFYYFSHLSLCAIWITNNRAQEKKRSKVMQDIFLAIIALIFLLYIFHCFIMLCVTLLFI
jgi:hypothetical protein